MSDHHTFLYTLQCESTHFYNSRRTFYFVENEILTPREGLPKEDHVTRENTKTPTKIEL